MDRHFARALLHAWNKPEFRSGLQHLIDLDEVTALLATLAGDHTDAQAQQRGLELLRSALETPEIRQAVLLLIDDATVREALGQGLQAEMADRPRLAQALRSALEDARLRRELHDALASPQVRALVWSVAESGMRERRLALVLRAVGLIRHRSVRHLVSGLARHGVLRELWRNRPGSAPTPAA